MTATVKVRRRGPLLLEGEFTILDAEGQPVAVNGPRVALCRCGASKCKPLCDGSHNRVGFNDDEPPAPKEP